MFYRTSAEDLPADLMNRLAQARTGTGKTIAFLMPVFQKIIKTTAPLPTRWRPSPQRNDIRAIIISPTRELAEQIATEARKIADGLNIAVQLAVGGTQKGKNLAQFRQQGCNILVGTPGRLNDLLSDPSSDVRAPNLEVFVLDEADRLLDDGFGPQIESIEQLLPDRQQTDRQTLMFSATVPQEVLHMVRRFMKPGYSFVNTVMDGEQQTHERVPQKIIELCGLENSMPALLELTRRELQRTGRFKAIVFFNSIHEVILARHTYTKTKACREFKFQALEIHSRLTQQARTRTSQFFRSAKSAIMFASDVLARGMDFPDVTHVIQMGPPGLRDDYIHRIGRTARGDKDGEAWMFAAPIEYDMAMWKLKDFPIKGDKSLECAKVDMSQDARLPPEVAQNLTDYMTASSQVGEDLKANAYRSCLGAFQMVPNKKKVVETINRRVFYGWGMQDPPYISPALAVKLGIARVEGLNTGRGHGSPQRRDLDRPYKSADQRLVHGGDLDPRRPYKTANEVECQKVNKPEKRLENWQIKVAKPKTQARRG